MDKSLGNLIKCILVLICKVNGQRVCSQQKHPVRECDASNIPLNIP